MKTSKHRILFCFFLFSLFLWNSSFVKAAVNPSAFENTTWSTVMDSSIIVDDGWLQGICVTDQYIVCFINASNKETTPDTLIAFYRNSTDASGNPVEPYSYAFHVTEMDYEHGNGMTYNPETREIAIAGLYTNDAANNGAVFVVDADTLQFKRKIQVGSGALNYFGIDYSVESEEYILMANRIADYMFVFADNDFQIQKTMNLQLSHSRSSFQDFCVYDDYIVSIPYMQREGYMNIIDIYSISQQKRIGSYYLTLPDSSFSVEPEGICQLEPGHFLLGCAVRDTGDIRIYETYLPNVFSITCSAEHGTITESTAEALQGSDFIVTYAPEPDYELESILVDGQEIDVDTNMDTYQFSNVQEDHTIQVTFKEKPDIAVFTCATPEPTPISEPHDETLESSNEKKEEYTLPLSKDLLLILILVLCTFCVLCIFFFVLLVKRRKKHHKRIDELRELRKTHRFDLDESEDSEDFEDESK